VTAADPWDRLARELDAWGAAGRVATLWWRDDDATTPSAALDRLLALGVGRAPVALAVVPEPTGAALARRLATAPFARVLQHGWAHRNHRPPGERSAEYQTDRPLAAMTAELAQGRERLADLFGARFLPVLVPPWNRIDDAVVAALPALGLRCLSVFGPRAAGATATVNTHVDPIAWRTGRGFVGETKALGELVGHLADRRGGAADPAEPTGLLTHHLVHDPALWRFLDRLLERTAAHPAARWLDPRQLFSQHPLPSGEGGARQRAG
jgi:peptidoglycan/xylan/chitin deacetylase (PgdA/CDA1 family)